MNASSPQDLAKGLNQKLKLGFTPRPWNLHAPGDTLWWLVPSTEWPAFSRGKLSFSFAKDDPRKLLATGNNDKLLELDTLLVALNVEKGYGNVASVVNPALKHKVDQILDPQWTWFSLVTAAGAARFSKVLTSMPPEVNCCIYVSASFAHDRESGPVTVQHDALMFQPTRTGLLLQRANACPVGVLLGAKGATNFTDLAERLRAIDDYHWVDMYVGVHVPKGEVDIVGLDASIVSPFAAWLR